jgi:hypothetical protein
MNTALFTRVALNGGGLIDDLQLIAICGYANTILGYDCNLGKQCTFGLPALTATAGMVMCALRSHGNLGLVCVAVTVQGSTGEIIATGLNAVVDCGM